MLIEETPEMAAIPRACFHTSDVAPGDRFECWQDNISPVVKVTRDTASAATRFSAEVDCFNLHDLLFADGIFGSQEMRLGSKFQGGEGADALLLRFYLEGGGEHYSGGDNTTIRPGDISLVDLIEPVIMDIEACQVLSLIIPRPMVCGYIRPDRLACDKVVGADTAIGRILGNYLRTLWRQLPTASMTNADTINQMLLGCIAGIFGNGDMDEEKVSPALEHADLEYMRAYIDRHLPEPYLGVDHLCQYFGYSRAALYRLFQPLGGVAHHIRQARLEQCRQELEHMQGSAVRIGDVSARWGFSNYGQFCRMFRSAFDMTPREAVARGAAAPALQGLPPISPRANMHATSELFAWIHKLSPRGRMDHIVG